MSFFRLFAAVEKNVYFCYYAIIERSSNIWFIVALLRSPQDGLYTGTIDAVDTTNNTYRITFDRQGLGTHTVPDYEVLSNR